MDYESGAEPIIAEGNKLLGPAQVIGSTGVRPAVSGESLIDLYLSYTKDLPTPRIFRLWAAIHAIGAAAERRVWTEFGLNRLHPNIFVWLVGPPGVGKTQAIEPMTNMLRKSGAVNIAPNDLSKQGLLDALGESQKGTLDKYGRPFDYHFLALCIRELTNFMGKYDIDLAGILTDLFDCPAANDEKKRSHDKGRLIAFPGLSFIMGTATQQLGHTISTEMWGSGFMARVIMVFSADKIVPKSRFAKVEHNEAVADEIVIGLRRIGTMVGEMVWTPDAIALLDTFSNNQDDGAPIHNRLTSYVTRRWLHLAKLCMIAALSDERQEVEADDFHLALSWLLEAEVAMPEVFKDMHSHEDGQIHEELRSAMFHLFIQEHRPIHHSLIAKWLSQKVASYQVPHIIAVALAAKYFERVSGTWGEDAEYIPQGPKSGKMPGAL